MKEKTKFPSNIFQSFLALLIMYGVLALSVFLFSTFNRFIKSEILFIVVQIFALLLIILIFTKFINKESLNLKRKKINCIYFLLLLASFFFLQLGIAFPIYLYFSPLSDVTISHNLLPSFSILLSSLILAPILEEIIFKNLLAKNSVFFALCVSSSLFALLHLNYKSIVSLLILGFYLGWIYFKSDNLFIVILLHISYNFSSFLISFLRQDNLIGHC